MCQSVILGFNKTQNLYNEASSKTKIPLDVKCKLSNLIIAETPSTWTVLCYSTIVNQTI